MVLGSQLKQPSGDESQRSGWPGCCPKVHCSHDSGSQCVGGLVTAGVQTPALQASPVEQRLPSSHNVPSGAVLLAHMPVAGSQTPPVWQASDVPVQTTGVPATQVPALQLSPVVQALLSEQVVPSAAAGFEQVPEVWSQVPATWHESEAVQVLTVPPEQAPAWQDSPVVHASRSLQGDPFGAVTTEQVPFAGLQTPGMWHESAAVQTTGVPPQTPPLHMSAVEQALPSLHIVPSGAAGFEQVPVV